MKFIKQNFLSLIVLTLLIIAISKISDLQVKYDNLNTSYFMLQSRINNSLNQGNPYQQNNVPEKAAMDVMSPSELAEYMGIEMGEVYDLIMYDNTMPYVQINAQYRFNKAAIDKWMDGRKSIEVK